jgi:hypothetical protein
LLLFAVVPQQLWVRWISHQPDLAERLTWLVAGSFLPLILFLYFNHVQLWAKVIAIGVALNLAAMIANGGEMPAPNQFAAAASNQTEIASERIIPGTKDKLITASAPAALHFLSDHFLLTLPTGAQRVVSAGDIFILSGGILALALAVSAQGSLAPRATDLPVNAHPE